MNNVQYWLMDGRANYSIDEATVLKVCNSVDEATKSLNNYGNDTCIVKVDGDKETLLFSLVECNENECLCGVGEEDCHDGWCPASKR